MTGIVGSGAVVLRTSEHGSAELAGCVVAALLRFSAGMTPSVLRGLADHEADLVCCARPSKGVGMSTDVTLRNSIGCLATLWIADSLKSTSEFWTT
jgi:hypothetical protein